MDLLKEVVGLESKSNSSNLLGTMKAIQKAMSSAVVHFDDMDPIPFGTVISLFKKVLGAREVALQLHPNFNQEEVRDFDNTQDVPDDVVHKIRTTFPLASLAYEGKAKIVKKLEDLGHYLVFYEEPIPGDVCTPGHFVSYDSTTKTVYVNVKGTSTVDDVITDLLIEPGLTQCLDHKGLVHSGIAIAAEHVVLSIRKLLLDLFVPLGYSIVFTGHSMGAGISALAAMMLAPGVMAQHALPERTNVSSVGFAPPPVCNEALAFAAKDIGQGEVISVVNRYDIVPRGSLRNVKALWKGLDTLHKMPNNKVEDLLKRVSEGDREAMLEIRDAVTQTELTLGDHDMLVPGRVVYFYERDHEEFIQNVKSDTGDDKAEEPTVEVELADLHSDGTAKQKAINGYAAILTDGRFPALQRLELDTRSFNDHFCIEYAEALTSTYGEKQHITADDMTLGDKALAPK